MRLKILLSAWLLVAGCACAFAANEVGADPFTLTIGIEGAAFGTKSANMVKARSDLYLEITTTNHSKHEMDCSKFGDSGTRLDPGYEYDLRDSSGNPVKKNARTAPEIGSFMGMGCRFKSGESSTSSSLITTAYDLSKPGQYTIRLARRISEKAGVDEGFVKSNVLTVTVTDDESALDKATPRFALSIAAYSNGRPSETNVPFVVRAGKDVGINITKRVTSKHDVDCSTAWSNMSGLDEKYQYDVRDSAGNPAAKHAILSPLPWASQTSSQVCRPGEGDSGSGNNSITRLYDLSKPGSYSIQVSQPVSDNPADGIVKSNIIRVRVTP